MSAEAQADLVFSALAHPARRRMLDQVKEWPGVNVGSVASQFDMSRIAVMKHLTVLEQAGLLISEQDGRSRRLYFNPVPIQQIYDRWTEDYSAFWSERVADIKARVEARVRRGKKKHG